MSPSVTLMCTHCRKDHVHHEHTAMKRWPETWGFLQNEYKSVSRACGVCVFFSCLFVYFNDSCIFHSQQCSSIRPSMPPAAIGSSSLCRLVPPPVMRKGKPSTSRLCPAQSSNSPTHSLVPLPGRWGGGLHTRTVHWSATVTGLVARGASSNSSSGPTTLSRDQMCLGKAVCICVTNPTFTSALKLITCPIKCVLESVS